jgi:eukaryotic-like serine/threonine-protein kinase
VFRAEDCVLGREVAIKRLHTEGREVDLKRFRREARLGASLSHPNLVVVFDTLSVSEGMLIVMEYVRGRPLSSQIPRQGMDHERLLSILHPVASALDHAHAHGVVHRDVKPANILIAEDGRVKLVDLGTATAGHLTQITTENEVVGTLAYIAPERLAGESVGEPAADVYSLATVAFEGLTWRRPYRAELLDRIDSTSPDLRDAWADAPEPVARVLGQAMDRDPWRRQASATALVRDLEGALARSTAAAPAVPQATEPIAMPSEQDLPSSPPPYSISATGRRGWALPVLVCILALLVGGAWLALSSAGGGGGGDGGAGGQRAASGSLAADGPQPDRASGASSDSSRGGSGGATGSPTPVSSATGSELNDDGFSLIQQGRYDEAIPVLRGAVASFPAGTSDITYAYALFNLGHALRMAGEPEKAIPILEKRLRIPDQTEEVQAELDAARAEARR